MKKIIPIFGLLAFFGCAQNASENVLIQEPPSTRELMRQVVLKPLDDASNGILFINMVTTKAAGDTFNPGELIGQVAERPEICSQCDSIILETALSLYESYDFVSAASLFDSLFRQYPNNLFLHELTAKSYFWIQDTLHKNISYELYITLIRKLDSQGEDESVNVVDMWFPEAYWKMASLHLDRKEWEKALYEIDRAYQSMGESKMNAALYKQFLLFLHEAHSELGNEKELKLIEELLSRVKYQPNPLQTTI